LFQAQKVKIGFQVDAAFRIKKAFIATGGEAELSFFIVTEFLTSPQK